MPRIEDFSASMFSILYSMLIERPPFFYRMLFPEAIWRLPGVKKRVFLTFDDGPVPQVTPWVLDVLDYYEVKATFFCVGDNVARNPNLFQEIRNRGHQVGNHTMNHVQGISTSPEKYVRNVLNANDLIQSRLFRPPHGHMIPGQAKLLKNTFNIIMWDVVTRDYSKKLSGEEVFNNVKRYARNGSIIVIHDSVKALKNLRYALPRSINWLRDNGYLFETL